MSDFSRLGEIAAPLLVWYDACARVLPWRDDPTPYHVLVSELMLQQTRVEAVRGHYARFLAALPDLQSLASCPDERLLKLWEGLGYYSRAKNLRAAAQKILSDFNGEVPKTPEQLRTLPGVGDYCAGSVSSIAYGAVAPAVDGNVLRVISRLAAFEEEVSLPAVKKLLTERVRAVLPARRCGDFNQALMDLGATVCLPNGAPLCGSCPLQRLCEGYRLGIAEALPKKAPRPPRRTEELGVLLLKKDGCLALRKRPARGLLGGLWELPTFSGDAAGFLSENGVEASAPVLGRRAKHVFTHVEWHMTSYEAAASGALPCGWVWASPQALRETYALPSAFAAFLPKKDGPDAEISALQGP